MPLTGIVLHSADQYEEAASSISNGPSFSNGPVAIAAIVPDTPAAVAGLRIGDGVFAIAGQDLSVLRPASGVPVRDFVYDILASQPAHLPLVLTINRHGETFDVTLAARSGCKALVEVLSDEAINGQADGRIVQISYGLAARISDEYLAVVLAHELAHLVLQHRLRLDASGSERKWGRQVEVEADRLSVHLLVNAGYDPTAAPRFWRSDMGRRAGGNIFRSSAYPSPAARAEITEQEIAQHIVSGAIYSWPGHLLSKRDQPFKQE